MAKAAKQIEDAVADALATAPAIVVDGIKASTTSKLVRDFKAARRAGVPIIAIETPDPAETIHTVTSIVSDKAPTFEWDHVRGLRGINKLGQSIADPEWNGCIGRARISRINGRADAAFLSQSTTSMR